MKSIFFSFILVLVSCTSYWDNNKCSETNFVAPSNASTAIIYMFEDPDQIKLFTYEYFQSELIDGTAVQGDMDYIRPDDVNDQCGIVFYKFLVLDSDGNDVTDATSSLFIFSQPVTW